MSGPATCLSTHCFCEAVADAGVRQPVNAWSSVAFVLAGCWIAASAWRGDRSDPRTPWLLALGAGGVLTGVGSGLYHAALTFDTQFLDVLGMHLIAGLVIAYALVRARYAPPVAARLGRRGGVRARRVGRPLVSRRCSWWASGSNCGSR